MLNVTFPYNLTNPHTLPLAGGNADPMYLPEPQKNIPQGQKQALVDEVVANITQTTTANSSSPCTKCKNALAIGQTAAQYAPALVPSRLVSLCQKFQFKSNASCEETYAASTTGDIWTQVLAYADV